MIAFWIQNKGNNDLARLALERGFSTSFFLFFCLRVGAGRAQRRSERFVLVLYTCTFCLTQGFIGLCGEKSMPSFFFLFFVPPPPQLLIERVLSLSVRPGSVFNDRARCSNTHADNFHLGILLPPPVDPEYVLSHGMPLSAER